MQFATIRQQRSGTDRYARQMGSRGRFFAFEYEVGHAPTIEGVGIQKNESWTHNDYWPEIKLECSRDMKKPSAEE